MGSVLPEMTRALRERTEEARRRVRPATPDELSIFKEAKRRAGRSKPPKEYSLSNDDVDLLITRAGGRCEATGLPFDDKKTPGDPYRKNRLSPDRLDNTRGYRFDNVRLVLARFNRLRGAFDPDEQFTLSVLHLAKLGHFTRGPAILADRGEPELWRF